MPPRLDAVFFRNAAGKEPVRDWLLSLTKAERRTIGTDIAYVQWKWPLGKPRVDHLQNGVWEVRSSMESRIARVLFAVSGGEMILLHGFIKKSQRAPRCDVDLALTRWRAWQDGENQ